MTQQSLTEGSHRHHPHLFRSFFQGSFPAPPPVVRQEKGWTW